MGTVNSPLGGPKGGEVGGTACHKTEASSWGKKIHLPALGRGQKIRWQQDFPAHPNKVFLKYLIPCGSYDCREN